MPGPDPSHRAHPAYNAPHLGPPIIRRPEPESAPHDGLLRCARESQPAHLTFFTYRRVPYLPTCAAFSFLAMLPFSTRSDMSCHARSRMMYAKICTEGFDGEELPLVKDRRYKTQKYKQSLHVPGPLFID